VITQAKTVDMAKVHAEMKEQEHQQVQEQKQEQK